MPYYVKSHGPVVVKRGPYPTEEEANRERDALALDSLYQGQQIIVEFERDMPPPRIRILKPFRRKSRPRRLSTRGSKRSSGGGGYGAGTTGKRRRKRGYKRSSKRR